METLFFQTFPGDFQATRTDGSEAFLTSFGVLQVELYSEEGRKLQLAENSEAILTIPVPLSMQQEAPQTIPLWYFDLEEGIWIEDGQAQLQGNTYKGSVSHFTPWNADLPQDWIRIAGRVTCNSLDHNNAQIQPLSGLLVTIEQMTIRTDPDGGFETFAPAGREFTVHIKPSGNHGIGLEQPITFGPFPAQSSQDLSDIVVDPCPAIIKGTIVGCDNLPIGGIIRTTFNKGLQLITATNDGEFAISVAPDRAIIIQVIAVNGGFSSLIDIPATPANTVFDIGDVDLCTDKDDDDKEGGDDNNNELLEFFDVPDIGIGKLVFTYDATAMAIAPDRNPKEIQILSTANGGLMSSFPISNDVNGRVTSLQFSTNAERLLVNFASSNSNDILVFDVMNGAVIRSLSVDISTVLLLSDGNSMLVSTRDKNVMLYDVNSGIVTKELSFTARILERLVDGTSLFVAIPFSLDRVVVWDMDTLLSQLLILAFPPGCRSSRKETL